MDTGTKIETDPAREGGTWSICWQAAVGRDFLVSPIVAAKIRGRLIDAHKRQGRVLVDFVLMPTEIHAISHLPAGDSIKKVARAFGTFVSRWVHQAHPVRSPVLAGPFRKVPIESADALRQEVLMLAWRPVVRGFSSTPTYYPVGGLRVALGLTASKGFDARAMLTPFGDTVPVARQALRKWIAKRPSEQSWRAWELTRELALATGTVGPHPAMAKAVGGAAASLIAAGGGYGIDGALDLLGVWVVAKIRLAAPIDLRADSNPGAARVRALVASLAVEHRLCSAASVARYYQRAKATLSEQMAACRRRAADRAIMGTPLARILEEAALLRGR